MKSYTSVAVLGSVDSGKTTLVSRLSDVISTAALDKHSQSKKRGVTIDLGFSAILSNDQIITLIDCPGHSSMFRHAAASSHLSETVLFVIDLHENKFEKVIELGKYIFSSYKNIIIILNKCASPHAQITNSLSTILITLFDISERIVPWFVCDALENIGIADIRKIILDYAKNIEIPFHDPLYYFEAFSTEYLINRKIYNIPVPFSPIKLDHFKNKFNKYDIDYNISLHFVEYKENKPIINQKRINIFTQSSENNFNKLENNKHLKNIEEINYPKVNFLKYNSDLNVPLSDITNIHKKIENKSDIKNMPFAMLVDHFFSTNSGDKVLTGFVIQGTLKNRMNVLVQNIKRISISDKTYTVKNIKSFHESIDFAYPKYRISVCLNNDKIPKIERGILASPGALINISTLLVSIENGYMFSGAHSIIFGLECIPATVEYYKLELNRNLVYTNDNPTHAIVILKTQISILPSLSIIALCPGIEPKWGWTGRIESYKTGTNKMISMHDSIPYIFLKPIITHRWLSNIEIAENGIILNWGKNITKIINCKVIIHCYKNRKHIPLPDDIFETLDYTSWSVTSDKINENYYSMYCNVNECILIGKENCLVKLTPCKTIYAIINWLKKIEKLDTTYVTKKDYIKKRGKRGGKKNKVEDSIIKDNFVCDNKLFKKKIKLRNGFVPEKTNNYEEMKINKDSDNIEISNVEDVNKQLNNDQLNVKKHSINVNNSYKEFILDDSIKPDVKKNKWSNIYLNNTNIGNIANIQTEIDNQNLDLSIRVVIDGYKEKNY